MSIHHEKENEQITQNQVNDMLTHQTRVATNMQKVKTGYDKDYYSMERTRQDRQLIDQMLHLPERTTLKLSDEQKYRLAAIQGRNLSHILLNQNSFAGDSEEMQAVKQSVQALEELVSRPLNKENMLESIEEIENAYMLAIAACQYYCDHKDPNFDSGRERKQAVADALESMYREWQQISKAKEIYQTKENQKKAVEKPQNISDLMARFQMLSNKYLSKDKENAEKEQEEESKIKTVQDLLVRAQKAMDKPREMPTGIQTLTYDAFTRMLGTYNRGQVEFDGQGLKIINNSALSLSSGSASVENRLLRERFLAVVKEKLDETQQKTMYERLRSMIGLDQAEEIAKPLSRTEIHDVVALVNDLTSVVDRTLRQGKEAPAAQHRIAMEVDRMIGGNVSEYERARTTSEQEKLLKKEINEILKQAQSDGFDVPKLSTHQMDNLVRGNISRLRDRIFLVIDQSYRYMVNLNGGDAQDFNQLAADRTFFNGVAARVIISMAAATETGNVVAQKELEHYVEEKVFEFTNKEALLKDFKRLPVPNLLIRDSQLLNRTVERSLSKNDAWKADMKKVKRGMTELNRLCQQCQQLVEYERLAFRDGLTPAQKQKFQQLEKDMKAMFTGDRLADLTFVVEGLKGTRFEAGFLQAKRLVGDEKTSPLHNSVENIIKATTIKKQDMYQKSPQEIERKKNDVKDQTANPQAKAMGTYLSSLSKQSRGIVEMLLLEKQPSSFVKNQEDDFAKSLLQLRKALRAFPQGQNYAENVNIMGVNARLEQSESGLCRIRLEDKAVPLPYSFKKIADHMERDMVNGNKENEKTAEQLYGKENIQSIFRSLDPKEADGAELRRIRNLCLIVLTERVGLNSAAFDILSTIDLHRLATQVLSDSITKQEVMDYLNDVQEKNQDVITDTETLELLKKMALQQDEVDKKVVLAPAKPKELQPNEVPWTPEAKQVKNLLAELIYSTETWTTDELMNKPEQRLRKTLLNHIDAVTTLVYEPQVLEHILDGMSLEEEGSFDMKEQLHVSLSKMFESPWLQKLVQNNSKQSKDQFKLMFRVILGDEKLADNSLAVQAINKVMESLLGKDKNIESIRQEILEQLAEVDIEIENSVEASMSKIQEMIEKQIKTVFDRDKDNQEEEEEEQHEDEESSELDKIIKEATKGDKGQGLFLQKVLSNYFTQVSSLDRRSMIASALRDAKQYKHEQMDKQKKAIMGNYLGGLLKGAGPLLQKMLQGMPLDAMPEELESALKDMKSNLAPIAPEVVKARLLAIVDGSGGSISKIEVTRAMGAASVGQVFHCKMYGPSLPKEGKDVVIKLLRPEARNRMMREKKIMLDCASQTDAGMRATYEGQLARIEEELDFRIEAENVEKGKVYNDGVKTVQIVKLNDLVAPTENTIVMEKAPGDTLDRYIAASKAEMKEIESMLYIQDPEDASYGSIDFKPSKINDMFKVRHRMLAMLMNLQTRQKYVAQLAAKWVDEGIFGRKGSGFYHGDLHAGNIMIDDNGATVIDFGNATKLNGAQQQSIIRMMMAATAGKTKDFRHEFHKLISDKTEEQYQKNRDKITTEFEKVLAMGKKKDAGKRIAAALIKAQELGVELPSEIYNFSQCQLRLQNAMDDMNQLIQKLQSRLDELATTGSQGGAGTDFICMNQENISTNNLRKTATPQQTTQQMIDRLQFNEAKELTNLRKTSQTDRDEFARNNNLMYYTPESVASPKVAFEDIVNDPGNMEQKKPVFKGIQDAIKGTLDFLETLYDPEELPRFYQISEELDKCFENPAESLETFKKLCDELADCKNLKLYHERLKALRDAQDDTATPANKLRGLEKDFMEIHQKICEQKVRRKLDLFTTIWNTLKYTRPEVLKDMDNDFSSWFSDRMSGGLKMQETYQQLRKAQKENAPDLAEKKDRFLEAYRQSAVARLKALIRDLNIEYDKKKPDTFYDVMSELLENKLKASLDKAGWWFSFGYRNQLSDKTEKK